MTDFGLHIVSPTVVDIYLNGTRTQRWGHTDYSAGAYLAIAEFFDSSPHIGTLVARSGGPSGSVVLTEPFDNLASWSLGHTTGPGWSISPPGFAYGNSISGGHSVLYRPMPAADYFELQDVTQDGDGDPDGWVMLVVNKINPTGTTTGTLTGGGYRLLLRPAGPLYPTGSLELADAGSVLVEDFTTPGGWAVGVIG